MRILFVNDFYTPYLVGGAEIAVKQLALGLKAHGHDILVVTARIGNTKQEEISEGIKIYRMGYFPAFPKAIRLASGTSPGSPSTTVKNEFEKIIHSFSPDVIHFHNIWLLGPSLLQIPGCRKGITLHDYWPFCLRRSMLRVGGDPCPHPGFVACRLCRMRAPATIRSLDLLNIEKERNQIGDWIRRCDFRSTPSAFMAERLSRFLNVEAEIIPNGILINKKNSSVSTRPPYVLYASRATRIKGYSLLLDAFSNERLRDVQLWVASNTTKSISRNITVLGWQEPEGVQELIADAKCVVVPSLWPENAPMIILESLSQGVPVVASRIGGIPELVEDGVTGILVNPGDVEALIDAICRCYEDQDLQNSARLNGPKFINKKYSIGKVLEIWEKIYAE